MPGKYKTPPSGNLNPQGKKILSTVYEQCRQESEDKSKCARIAWGAVKRSGYR